MEPLVSLENSQDGSITHAIRQVVLCPCQWQVRLEALIYDTPNAGRRLEGRINRWKGTTTATTGTMSFSGGGQPIIILHERTDGDGLSFRLSPPSQEGRCHPIERASKSAMICRDALCVILQ